MRTRNGIPRMNTHHLPLLLSLVLIVACSGSPEPSEEGTAPERTAPSKDHVAETVEPGAFSARVDGQDWQSEPGKVKGTVDNDDSGSIFKIHGSAPTEEGTLSQMTLIFPYFLGEDTVIEQRGAEISGSATFGMGKRDHQYHRTDELKVNVHKVRHGATFRLEGSFSARSPNYLRTGAAQVIEQGAFQADGLREPLHILHGATEEGPYTGRVPDYGFAMQQPGKYPGTDTHVILYSTVFKYHGVDAERTRIEQWLDSSFDARIASMPVKPTRLLGGGEKPRLYPETSRTSSNRGRTNDERQRMLDEMAVKGPFNGGTYEFIEVAVPDSL